MHAGPLVRRALAALTFAAMLAGATPALAAPAASDPLLDAVRDAADAQAIAPEQAAAYRAILSAARATRDDLVGVRRRELAVTLKIAASMARRGTLTPSRLPIVFLTLRRNTEWWAAHGPPTAGSPGEGGARGRRCAPGAHARAARVSFPGSQLVFQYYRGLGLQLQFLGSFARASTLLGVGDPALDAQGVALLDELVPLASQRGGLLAWEYVFPFGGGQPPWTSAISQGTAMQALTRAATRTGRLDLLAVAERAADVFAAPPPVGVNVRLARDGSWFAHYTFAPGLRVLNGHLQALNGLHDYAVAAGDPRALGLYREGLRAARRHIGGFDTGRWSKYANPGREADLNYHVLNRDVARALCARSGDAAICGAARRYARQLDRRCPRVAAATGARDG